MRRSSPRMTITSKLKRSDIFQFSLSQQLGRYFPRPGGLSIDS
jgi:hypothetical protein